MTTVVADEEDDANEQKIAIGDAPQAVQSAIKTASEGGQLGVVTKESDEGFTTYEAEFQVGSVNHSIKLSDAGAILERESDVGAAALPASVVAQIQKQFPKATIKNAEEVVLTYYEVEIETGKKGHEVKVFANGQPVDDEEE